MANLLPAHIFSHCADRNKCPRVADGGGLDKQATTPFIAKQFKISSRSVNLSQALRFYLQNIHGYGFKK
jgi:hypothetical protein